MDKSAQEQNGTVSLRLQWKSSSEQSIYSVRRQSVTGDVCQDYTIDLIRVEAINTDGITQGESAVWPCSQHRGQLRDLPVGIYRIIVTGEVGGIVSWRGQAEDVIVVKNQTTDAGVIKMTHLHDHTAPTIIQTQPVNGAEGVPVNTTITALFDEAIVPESIKTDNFLLYYQDNSDTTIYIECDVDYNSDNHIAVLKPISPLVQNTKYTAIVTIDQDLVVQDLAGNGLQAAVQWSFHTDVPDMIAPEIESRVPGINARRAPLNTTVRINFSEAMHPQTISEANIVLRLNENPVDCGVNYDDGTYTTTITPTNDLLPGVTYHVYIDSSITDLAGNALLTDANWTFTTIGMPTEWTRHTPDRPKRFKDLSITTDHNGGIHVVYGCDSLYYAYFNGEVWHYDIVDLIVLGPYSNSVDIAVDAAGNAHISYYANDDLKYATNQYSDEWTIEIVDSEGYAGSENALAVDTSGNVHISYKDYLPHYQSDLKYALRDSSGQWTKEVIEQEGEAGLSSIAVDAIGGVHVSYYQRLFGDGYYAIKYAAKSNGGSWTKEVITDNDIESFSGRNNAITVALEPGATDNVHVHIIYDNFYTSKVSGGSWTKETYDDNSSGDRSIAVDSSGQIHISYLHDEFSNEKLKYAVRNISGQWVNEIVEENTGRYNAIAVDSSGVVYISYYDEDNNEMRYTQKNNQNNWISETLDKEGVVGENSSLVMDAAGYAHISYDDQFSNTVKYANNVGGKWISETVDSGKNSSIAIDESGNVHISYYASNARLKYAVRDIRNNWMIQEVDKDRVGFYNSIAVEGNGIVHICYSDETNYDLKYAQKDTSGSWSIEIIDKDGNIGKYNSIALDASGQPHISYYDRTHQDLRYTYKNQPWGWIYEKVDSVGVVGLASSIAVDASGQVYISYQDLTDYPKSELKYAFKNSSGNWTVELIEDEGNVTKTAIAVDLFGNTHISYFSSSDIKYATNAIGTWQTEIVDSIGSVVSTAYYKAGPSIAVGPPETQGTLGHVYISYYCEIGEDLVCSTSKQN